MHERERYSVILDLIRERSVATLRQLMERTGASAATTRRDLQKLAQAGHVRRVHGGVEAASAERRPRLATHAFEVASTQNIGRKRAIAREAALLCEDHESIIINAGSTTFEMAEALRRRRLQILTNSFPIAQALIDSENRIMLPGGEIYREQGIILSPFDADSIQHYSATKMFMGAYSIGPMGVIEGDPLIARAEAKLMARAEKLVLLVDSSKFATRGSLVVCGLGDIDTLITDDAAPPEMLDIVRGAGVEVRVVRTTADP
jgi:DeoR family ulaG and ulaABCDEF operon transcriptional repressor